MDAVMLYLMATCIFSVTIVNAQDGCNNPLGMKDGTIQDSQITSSSVYSNTYITSRARLDGSYCWVAKKRDTNQWIRVDFNTPMYVSAIILQGSPNFNEWVTAYMVQYGNGDSNRDDSNWMYVKDGNQNNMEFEGNSDRNTHVTGLFTSEVRVTRIRIRPTTWNGYISLRFEILGCEDIDDCNTNPCMNGRCVGGINQYTCDCNDGWAGMNCDQNIDECESSPCANGQCEDDVNQYTCRCHAGWSGTNCDQNIDECENRPCANGQCEDDVNKYRCICTAGWTGTNCDQNMIDECESSPCANGQCDDGVNLYRCRCHAGWSGTNCDQNINECDGSPCVNGQCEDDIDHFTCDCDNGWTGIRCDQTLTTTINAAAATTSSIEASTSNNISGSFGNQNSPGSASTATGIAIAFVLLLVIIGCVVALVVVKRRRQQRQPQENSNSKNVLQLDGPYGDTITNIITSPPTNDAHIYAGVTGPNGDAVATPPSEELYQDVSDKPGKVQQDMDDTYQDITEESTQANQGINNNDIYQDVRDNEYAYAHVDTERDKVPSVDGDLVQIYARSQYGGVPSSAQNVNQQEGWADNDIYAMSDEDPQLKRQPGGDNREEGWVENDIYARSDEDQLNRQGGENDEVEGWMDNSIYATTDE